MTKHEADVIGGLNMTDQISNEAYKQIMIAAQDENEVGDVLDKIRAEIDEQYDRVHPYNISCAEGLEMALEIIDKYRKEQETETWNGIHAQITAPKGTFDKIWEEADEEDYIEDDIERKIEWMEEQEYLDDKYGKEQE